MKRRSGEGGDGRTHKELGGGRGTLSGGAGRPRGSPITGAGALSLEGNKGRGCCLVLGVAVLARRRRRERQRLHTHRAARSCSGSWRCSPGLRPPSGTGRGPPGPVAGGRGRGGCTGAGFPRPTPTRGQPCGATPVTPRPSEFCSTHRDRRRVPTIPGGRLRRLLGDRGPGRRQAREEGPSYQIPV